MSIIRDPYTYLLGEFAELVCRALADFCPSLALNDVLHIIEEPPRREYGDLSLPMYRLLKYCKVDLSKFANAVRNISLNKIFMELKIVNDYLNVRINTAEYAKVIINAVRGDGANYGLIPDDRKLNIVIEFVSANPVHPLHIGSGRNAVLGDFLARLFEVKGHNVQRRYYINDLGRQVATLVYGYMRLGMPTPPEDVRPDIWFGLIYAVTNTIIDILRLRKELSNAGKNDPEAYVKQLELDELIMTLSELRSRNKELVDRLLDNISRDSDPDKNVEELMMRYESGDPKAVSLFRFVVAKVLSGIQETLRRLNVRFDKWDWESDLVFNGMVRNVLELARKSNYFILYKGAPALDFSSLQHDPDIKKSLKLPKSINIPPLILMRSDGTSLYVTRDIAYTIMKFNDSRADLVINVIANEQTLAQAQLRLALYALGFKEEAVRTIHFSYELVNLPGVKMSGRRGRYVSVDEVLDNLEYMVEEIMRSRGSTVSNEVKKVISVGAFKYMMLASSPNKVINFDANEALNLNRNSAPYLQYTYARTCGVLNKYGRDLEWDLIDYSAANVEPRRELLYHIGKFPYIISKVATDLEPEILIVYLNRLADLFNSWYDQEPILKEVSEGIKQLKLFITYATNIILRNGLGIMGIDVLERI